jgi:hypothetical protein
MWTTSPMNRSRLPRLARVSWLFALVAAACGGSTMHVPTQDAAHGAGGSVGAGGAAVGGTGGSSQLVFPIVLDASPVSKDDRWIPAGNRDVSTEAGVLECACGSDNTAPCDESVLADYFHGYVGGTVGTQCILFPGSTGLPDAGANLEVLGPVAFGSDGRALDGSGPADAGPLAAISALASYRWPCLAGQTVSYVCWIGYE